MHRSDGSGTTFNFAYYLSEVSADWKSKVGVNTAVEWPVGIGAKGNEGVANNVGQDQGLDRLRRVRLRQAEQADLTKMINKDGKTVAPTSEAFQAAAANADWKSQPGYGVILANQPGDEVLADDGRDLDPRSTRSRRIAAATGEALKFFAWAYARAARWPRSSTTCRCPPTSSSDVEKIWATEIKDASGKPLYAMIELIDTIGKRRRRGALSLSTVLRK